MQVQSETSRIRFHRKPPLKDIGDGDGGTRRPECGEGREMRWRWGDLKAR